MRYRTLAFIILTISFLSNIHSQDYKPILVEGSAWNEVFYFEQADPRGYIIGGDTVLNNISYKKVYQNIDFSIGALSLLMREDITERKVYLLEDFDPAREVLLYDFSLEVGDFFGDLRLDSITVDLNPIEADVLTFDIDTRVFYFSLNDYLSEVWINGVGSISGLLNGHLLEEFLLCHHDANGFLDVSINPEVIGVENCLLLDLNNFPDLIASELVPNPASSNLSLELKEFIRNGEIKITDITGKNIMQIPFIGEEIDMDIQGLNSGIFILQIYASGNLIGSRKFLKI
jgi:hypothetical protein